MDGVQKPGEPFRIPPPHLWIDQPRRLLQKHIQSRPGDPPVTYRLGQRTSS